MSWGSEGDRAHDVIVVGGGPVGMFAAFYAGLSGASVQLLESRSVLGGQPLALYPRKLIYDVPACAGLEGYELVERLHNQLDLFEPGVCTGCQVTGLQPRGDLIQVMAGEDEFWGRSVILATGVGAFQPRRLDLTIPPAAADRVWYKVREVEALRGKRVMIVGGGDSALDRVLTTCNVASTVILVHRRRQFKAHPGLLQRLGKPGISYCLPYALVAVEATPSGLLVTLEHQETGEQREVPVDYLIPSIGITAKLGPVKDWGLEMEGRKITVDEQQRANLPHVYAVGDACTYRGKAPLIAGGFGEAVRAVQSIKAVLLDPQRAARVVHSTQLDIS